MAEPAEREQEATRVASGARPASRARAGPHSAASNAVLLSRLAATAAASPGGLAGAIGRTDAGARARAAETLQAASGNLAVHRLMKPDTPALQRQPSWGGGTKHTFKHSHDIEIKKGFGPVQLSKITPGGEVTVDLKEGAGAQAGSKTQARVGAVGGPGNAGVQAEVERELGEKWKVAGAEFQPKVKLGGELTKKGGEIGIEGGFEGKNVSTSLKFVVIGKDFSKPESSLEIAALKWKVLEVKKEFEPVILGKTRKVEFKGSVELTFEPNWIEIGKWLLQRLATAAAGEALLMFGILAAGAATIAYAIYAIVTRHEIRDRVEDAAGKMRNAKSAYKAVMQGGEASGGEGAEFGTSEANKELDSATTPLPAIHEEMKKHDLDTKAHNAIAPHIRKKAIDSYWETHWFEKWVTDGKGMGSGGFLTFMRVLDAAVPESV